MVCLRGVAGFRVPGLGLATSSTGLVGFRVQGLGMTV